MMWTRTRAMLAALPLAVTLALVGCGSGGGGGEVASANDAAEETPADGESGGAGESATPGSQDEMHEMGLQFAQCLREHGVDVDDPQPGQGIQLQVEPEDQATAEEAMEACEEFLPPAPPPEDEEEIREDMLQYAECMRDNGVEEFADPKPGEGINIGPEVAEDPDFEQAEQICEEIFGGDRGERVENRS